MRGHMAEEDDQKWDGATPCMQLWAIGRRAVTHHRSLGSVRELKHEA